MDNLEQKINRREFLTLAGKGAGALMGAAVLGTINQACKSSTGTSPPATVTLTGYMRGLIRGNSVDGQIIFNGNTRVPINAGVYNVMPANNLTEGTYTIRIETAQGFPRETTGKLSNQGLYQTSTGLPIDNVIEQNSGYDIGTYQDFLSIYGSQRWLKVQPKFFVYDKSLFSGKTGTLQVIDSNYQMNPTTVASIEYVVSRHIGLYTNNFVQGQLYKESQGGSKPDPLAKPAGWIIYLDRDDSPYSITQGMDGNDGGIYFGLMTFQPAAHPISGISIDTAQTLGIGQDKNSGQILAGTEPSPLVTNFISKIIYNRDILHTVAGGIDKEQ